MLSVLFYLLIVVVTLIIKILLDKRERDDKLKSIFSPPGMPVFGHLFQINSPQKVIPGLLMLKQEHGNLLRIRPGILNTFILLSDEKQVEQLLSNNKFLNKSKNYKFMKGWLGTGLLTAPAEQWPKSRKMITPAFHFQILEQFIEVFNSCAEVFVSKLGETEGKAIDIYPFLTALTLDVICETAMGVNVDAQNNNDTEYVNAIREITRIVVRRSQRPIAHYKLFYMLTKDYWLEQRVLKVIHSYTDNVIAARRKLMENSGHQNEQENYFGIKKKMAFLDLLLQANFNGKPMTDKEIRDEVNTVLFAGHDTSSTALSFTFYLLSKHPEAQEKIYQELKTILEDDFHRHVNHKDIHEMKYLEMVLKESMRLYPPVTIFSREVKQDEKFGDATIPPNVPLMAFPYALHMDPKNFPEPEKFDPERFSQENQVKRGPYSYIPFSAGARNCIGQKFAMLEMKTALAHVIRNFEIKPVPGHELKTRFEIVLKPIDGIHVMLVPRKF